MTLETHLVGGGGLSSPTWARRRRACTAARMQSGQRRSAPNPDDLLGERSFLPSDVFAVSYLLDSSEDVVSRGGNDFYHFCALSSFISCQVTIFAYVASHLLGIETTIMLIYRCLMPIGRVVHASTDVFLS
jgi:hypothetical protein